MSCAMNGLSFHEGPANFAVMPATIRRTRSTFSQPLTAERVRELTKQYRPSVVPLKSVALSAAERKQIVELCRRLTPTEVAKQVGRSQETVRRVLRAFGIVAPKLADARRLTAAQEIEVARLVRTGGLTMKEAAARFDCSVSSVWRAVRHVNLGLVGKEAA